MSMGLPEGDIPRTSMFAIATLTTVTLLVLASLLQRLRFNKQYKLPTRIPGIPFFGNSFQLPRIQQGPWGKAMAEKYGEM